MKLVHINVSQVAEKRIHLYKDRSAIEAGKRQAIRENNERLRKQKTVNQ